MFTADSEKPTIPEGEIKALIRQGADSGVFEALERDMMPRCCASVTVLTREDEFLEDKSLEDESLRVNCGLYLDAFTKRIDHAIVEIDQESHNHTLAGFVTPALTWTCWNGSLVKPTISGGRAATLRWSIGMASVGTSSW